MWILYTFPSPQREIKICHDYPITHHHKFKLHIQIIVKYLEKNQHIGFMKPFHAFSNRKKKPPKEKRKKNSVSLKLCFLLYPSTKVWISVSLRLTTAWIIETWQYIDNQVSIYRIWYSYYLFNECQIKQVLLSKTLKLHIKKTVRGAAK